MTSTITTPETQTFSDLGVEQAIVDVLTSQGILTPFPIQTMTLPDAFAGKDITGKAETGSGKTLAFGIPMLTHVGIAKPKKPQGLILVPTRELANQVTKTLAPLLEAKNLTAVAVYGGAPMGPQIDALAAGASIAIATPGRLIRSPRTQGTFAI